MAKIIKKESIMNEENKTKIEVGE
jgi:hypothetical protein